MGRRSSGGGAVRGAWPRVSIAALNRGLLVVAALAAVMLLVSLRSLDEHAGIGVERAHQPRSFLRHGLDRFVTSSSATAPRSQRAFFKQRASKLSTDQQQVVDMTKHAWNAYREYADWRDFLNVYHYRGGSVYDHDMALTLVDSLDTLFVLGLHDEFDEASAWVKANLEDMMLRRGKVSFFEVTIRSLGGLLSAYYLSAEAHFLSLATTLADRLTAAFVCDLSLPCQKVDLLAKFARGAPSLAEVGTFQLEFTYLSHVTHDPKYSAYVDAVNRITQNVVRTTYTDGLIPVRSNWSISRDARSKISWGAHGDSYYEYLLKQWLQSNKQDDELKRQYMVAVDGMKARLLDKSYPSGYTFLGEINEFGHLRPVMEHLTCFVPGLLALGYKHEMPADHLDIAKELTRTCVQMYKFTTTGVAPEITSFTTKELHGFTVHDELYASAGDDYYILRPETVESLMILHRITGDPIYREHGRSIMNAIERHCKVETGGYRSIQHVVTGPVLGYRPDMESFFLAETLKYLYLLFSDDDVLPLDDIVFNTEAHPFPILK